jgi:hypothetical protein
MDTIAPSRNLTAALALAAQGFAVFPVHSGGAKVKQPVEAFGWKKISTTEAGAVDRLWRRNPSAGVAIDLAKSGLIVIDADRHGAHDGVAAFGQLMADHGHDPDSGPIVETPNSGCHLYFRQWPGEALGNARGSLPAGIDVRGAGGYVVAPGTVLEDGRVYELHGDLTAIPTLPAWLRAILTSSKPAPKPQPIQRQEHSDARVRAYVDAAVEAETARVRMAGEGQRNHSLNQAAFSLGQLVGAGWIEGAEVEGLLTNAAHEAGLKQPEIRKTIRSGLTAGQREPRQLSDAIENPEHAEAARRLIEHHTGALIDQDTGEIVEVKGVRDCRLPFPPGLVGALAHWITASARRPQPELAIGAALTIVGTIAGRQFAGPTHSGTHLYVLGLAPTGKGKDHPLQAIGRVMTAAKCEQHLGPSEFISMPAVVNFLDRRPLSVCAMDEFGGFMARINSKRASGFEGAISKILRTLWSSSFAPYMTPEWAQKASVTIHAPAMSIFGASTPEQFYKSMEGASIEDGTLNRFLIIQGRDKVEEVEPTEPAGIVPPDILAALRDIYDRSGPLALSWRNDGSTDILANNAVRMVQWCADGSQERYSAFLKELEGIITADPFAGAFYARTAEMALRIATIVAIGRMEDDRLRKSDLEFGIIVAKLSSEIMAEGAAEYMSENENQANAQKIVRLIKQRGGKMSRRELLRSLQNTIKSRDLKDLLQTMCDGGQIEEFTLPPPPSGGRPSINYRIT